MGGLIEGAILTAPLEHPEPGVYIAAATDPAYGWLKGLAVEGAARILGERYEVDGTKLIAVEILGAALAANQRAVRYRIGKAFFSAALDDYKDWKEKWWREAIQNAVDAGATKIDCRVEVVPEGVSVSCADNGRGMDADTIENKFLVGGETTKTGSSGEAGGFGKAKELLILPWIAWSMHSRAARFYGSGDEGVMEDAPYRDGTELRVVMPADNTTSAEAAMEFIGKCSLPSVQFTVNGQVYRADLDPGEEITDFHGKAVLFHNKKSAKRWNVLVRTKGLYMFSFAWLPSALEGSLTLELVGRSKELLTANRDGFRDETLAHDVDQFVRKVSVDVKSALEKKKNHFDLRFEGTGKFAGAPEKELQATMLSHLEEIVPRRQPGGRVGTLSSDQILVLTEIIANMSGGESVDDEKEGGDMNLRTTPEIAAALLDGIPMGGTDAVEAAIRQLSWEPDFFMSNKVDGFHPPKMFYPKTMTASLRKLAKLWAELCRFVLIQLGSKERFGVGWIFAEGTGAAYQELPDKDEHWLLFNPFKRPRSFDYSAKPGKDDLYNPSDDDDLAWLYASAIHECTHMADGFDEHDESFASAFTRNVAKIAGKERQIRAIRKAVVARGPKKASAPRRPQASQASPGLRELPALANAGDEAERRSATMRGGYRYAMFVGAYDSHKEDFSDDLTSETLARHRGVRDVEWRDKQAGGASVWRSKDFSVPLESARSALPELSDEELRTRRQEDARYYNSQSTKYVAFKNESTSVWDYLRNLSDLIRIMEAETGGSDYAEIRSAETGEPVWRSANFGAPLLMAANSSNGTTLYVEGPLSQGSPWTLRYGSETAIVSEFTAIALAARYDVPIGPTGRPGAIKESPLGLDPSVYDEPLRLSKKAAGILARAGIVLTPNQYEQDEEGPHSWKPNGRLRLSDGRVDTKATPILQSRSRLAAKNHGDLNSAVESAAYYARKLGETMYGYAGNSFGHMVWRVSQKASEYLDPINNGGAKVFSVQPDLTMSWHDVEGREAFEENAKSVRQLEAEKVQASMVRATAQEKLRARREQLSELEDQKRSALGSLNRFARSARARTVLDPTTLVRGDRCYLASEEGQRLQRKDVDTFYADLRREIVEPIEEKESKIRDDIERIRDVTALQTGKIRTASGKLRGVKLRESREESDDEVEHEIDPSLVPLWRRVKRRFVETPKMSRAEAFQHWVDEHPDEVTLLLEQESAPQSRALGREQWDEAERRRGEEAEHARFETEPSADEIVEDDDGDVPFN